jgi:hypothetical protein
MSLTIESQETSVGEIINDFEQCTRGLWSATTKYQKVTALLISWLDDDLGVDKEVDRLELLFKHEFRYETERYHIPSSDSAAELSYRLSTFIKDHALDTNVLSIFYYAGHGDNTAEGTAGYPEWRAYVLTTPKCKLANSVPAKEVVDQHLDGSHFNLTS